MCVCVCVCVLSRASMLCAWRRGDFWLLWCWFPLVAVGWLLLFSRSWQGCGWTVRLSVCPSVRVRRSFCFAAASSRNGLCFPVSCREGGGRKQLCLWSISGWSEPAKLTWHVVVVVVVCEVVASGRGVVFAGGDGL